MAKVTPIEFAERVAQRDADAAVTELRGAITGFGECPEHLGSEFPGTVAIGAIVCGQPTGLLVIAESEEAMHCSPVVLNRMRTLARVIGNLPAELLDQFQAELDTVIKFFRRKEGA